MKKFFIAVSALLSLFTTTVFAAPSLLPSPPKLAATGYLLIDYNSGYVMAENKADQRMEPASLTKMLSGYVVMHEIKTGRIALTDMVRISKKAWQAEGSRMFVEVDTQVSVEDLLKGMIIQSGNDATIALAEYVAGTEEAFAHLMNQHAKRLGMNDSHFVNSTGLPNEEHYTTPHDLARLATAVIRDDGDYYGWYADKELTYNNIKQYNRNKLLWRDESVDGIKTGHTESAGYCQVTSAIRNGMRVIAVVMGTDSENARAAESQKLLNYGFRFFETHKLYGAMQPLKNMRIWKGDTDNIELGLAEDLYITVPAGQYDKLNATLSVDPTLVAPAKKGQSFGSVSVKLGDENLAARPLIALQDVNEGGLVDTLVDSVMMLLQ